MSIPVHLWRGIYGTGVPWLQFIEQKWWQWKLNFGFSWSLSFVQTWAHLYHNNPLNASYNEASWIKDCNLGLKSRHHLSVANWILLFAQARLRLHSSDSWKLPHGSIHRSFHWLRVITLWLDSGMTYNWCIANQILHFQHPWIYLFLALPVLLTLPLSSGIQPSNH